MRIKPKFINFSSFPAGAVIFSNGQKPDVSGNAFVWDVTTKKLLAGPRLPRKTIQDEDYVAPLDKCVISQTAPMTAPRIVTIPLAADVGEGAILVIVDESGTVDIVNSLSALASGANTINGLATQTIITPYGYLMLMSNGGQKFTILSRG